MTNLLQQLFNTLSLASIYVLVAVGLTIIFGLSQIVNFAYGDLMTVGAYAVFVVAPSGAIAFLWGFWFAAAFVGLACFLLERLLFQWTLIRPVNGFLISLGLVQIIENAIAAKYTANPVAVQSATNTVWSVDGVDISADRVIIILGTVAILAVLMFYLGHTREGLAIRAVSSDREAAALMGAPVKKLVTRVFTIGGVIAGMGGAFISLINPITPFIGAELILKGFVVALVGGLGSVRGALIGAAVLAAAETAFVMINLSSWLDPLEFGLAILLLLLRPQGLVRGVAHSL
jgi:branched-chain amino acid transport system permease protein